MNNDLKTRKLTRRRIITFMLLLTNFLITSPVFAWGYKGHILIAQIAYDNLTPSVKIKSNKMALYVFDNLSAKMQERLNRVYPHASVFAKVAVLPDYWRNWKLATVFRKNHAQIPLDLQPYEHGHISSWHYINHPYPRNKICHTIKKENVVWAIDHIEHAVQPKNSMETNAVLMVFLEHFVGDAHQPLHTISHVNQSCQGDKGGNLFCLKLNGAGHCSESLHALWDNGVGYFKWRATNNLTSRALRLQKQFSENTLTSAVNDLSPADWVKSEYHFAPFIYSVQEYQKPTLAYYQEGQAIAKRQIILAGYRLSHILDALL